MLRRIGLLTLALALATSLGGCSNDEPARAPPLTFGPPRVYHFQLDGERADHPFNDKVFFRVTTRDVWRDWEAGAIGEDGRFALEGGSNERYEVRTEENPSEVEREVFWMLEATGRLPELDPTVTLALPPRTRVRIPVPEHHTSDAELSFVNEETWAVGTARNDPNTWLFEAIWRQGEQGNAYRRPALPAPCTFGGFRPGKYALAVRVPGRQWWTQRVELEPDAVLDVPAAEQPEGGGTVVADEGGALLRLFGDFPVAAPRNRVDLRYRETWEGVPPGEHQVQWKDGRRTPVTIEGDERQVVQPPDDE